MKVTLVVVGGKRAGMEIPISVPRFLIGRGEDCHMRPQSNLVNQRHCVITVGCGSVSIENYDSAHGTFVNGERIQMPRALYNGDRIQIGALEFELRFVASEPRRVNMHFAACPVGPTGNPNVNFPGQEGSWRVLNTAWPGDQPVTTQNINTGALPANTQAMPTAQETQEKRLDQHKAWGAIDVLLLAGINGLVWWLGCAATALILATVLTLASVMALYNYIRSERQSWDVTSRGPIHIGLKTIDFILVGVCLVFVGSGEFLLRGPADWWGWYIGCLDLHNWPPRAWLGIVAALAVILLMIRFVPRMGRSMDASQHPG